MAACIFRVLSLNLTSLGACVFWEMKLGTYELGHDNTISTSHPLPTADP